MLWKKIVALALVIVMTATAFAMMTPAAKKPSSVPDEQNPASVEYGGSREVTYTLSGMFESYKKKSDNVSLGAGDPTNPGINEWWYKRNGAPGLYGDTVVRDKYPFAMAYDPYGYKPAGMSIMGFGVYSWYRLNIDANNLTTIGTDGAAPNNKDPLFIPILNTTNPAQNGGWVNWSYHLTYLTSDDVANIVAGTHYANVYYSVLPSQVDFSGGNEADGWYVEISGKVDFTREAAKRFLGLGGVRDLRNEFTEANAGNALGIAWNADWAAEGSKGGKYDVYAAYAYSIDAYAGSYSTILSLDPSSTADKLVVRIWHKSWGAECLMDRYLDVSGVTPHWDYIYPEDFYVNGTVGPVGADLTTRGFVSYHIYAQKDPNLFAASWWLEPTHLDYMANTMQHPATDWKSHFNPYNKAGSYAPAKVEWTPGTTAYGTRVAYWNTPDLWNLSAGEKLIVKLGNRSAWGITPYVGGSDTLDSAKVAELMSNGVWGELVLGHTLPNTLYSSTYYDHATKTLTLTGPMNFPGNFNPSYPRLNETGEPLIPLTVARVSYYQVVVAPGPYLAGTPYTVTITALNHSLATVTNWNGTVTLSSNNLGTTFLPSSHTFQLSDNGVWQTTVTFGTPNHDHTWVNATDQDLPLDVTGNSAKLSIGALIPEFPTLLIPVIGAVAVFVVIRRRKSST